MKNKYMPYNFDYKYEYKSYKNVGVDVKINYKSKSNVFYKLRQFIRNLFNKNEKRYKKLNTYSDWENYVINSRKGRCLNRKDFIHFLRSRERVCEYSHNIVGSVVTPMYVVLLSGGFTILLLPNENNPTIDNIIPIWLFFTVLLSFILFFLMKRSHKKRNEYYFYKDYIKIINKQMNLNKQENNEIDTNHQ